nr:reverse transcriptase domain-containing protein [Tanacetum cinerariifolium]
MSDSEDSTITYTVAPSSLDYVSGPKYPPSPEFIPEPVYPKFMPAEDDILPIEEQPLPAAASPTTESSGYIDESDPEDDPEEDPEDDPEEDPKDDPGEDLADYPADEGDETPSSLPSDTEIARLKAIPTPPPSPLSLLSSPLPQIPSPPLHLLLSPLDPEEGPEDDPKEVPVDYPADGGDEGDDKDESSDDDEDDDIDAEGDEEEDESSNDDEDDDIDIEGDEEEDKYLAPIDFIAVALPSVDHAPSAEETESFETDESAATPPTHPAYRVSASMSIRPQTPISLPSDTEIARLMAIPTPPPSPLSLLSSPLPQIPSLPLPLLSPPSIDPTYEEAPLGYRLSTAHTGTYELGESSATAAARLREPVRDDLYRFVDTVDRGEGTTPAAIKVGYGITNAWDDLCMQTHSSSRLVSNPSSNLTPSTNPNPKGRNRRRSKQRIEEFNLDELSPPIVTMVDQCTMAQLLQAPTEGYEDAIVVPAITADNFELKHGLLTLVTSKQFFRHDKEDPYAHIRYFNKITSTLKFLNILNTLIKLMLFPFSLEGAARIWLEKEPLDRFSLGMISFRNSSTNSFTFQNNKSSMHRECLVIIESKSKVCYSHNKPVVTKVGTNTSTFGISPDVVELKDMVKALLLDKKSQNQAHATMKAVEESCVPCSGAPSYRNCLATYGKVYHDNIQEFVSQVSAVNYNQGNTSYRPSMMSNQIRPPGFLPVPNNQNVQLNQRNNQNPYQAPTYQAPAPQTQGVLKEDFSAYVKANDAVMRKMQTQAITTRSGVSYDGPQIPPPPFFLPKLVENEPEATKDTVNPTNNGSTKDVQPPVVQTETPEIQIFKPISKPVNSPPIIRYLPVGVVEDVHVKVGSFHFLADFVVVDFDVDPRVPLILRRSFLKTRRALIDVFEGELTFRVGKEAITFNLDQTLRYSANYNKMTAKRMDVIDMACEEYSQEVLGFSDVITSGNPTPYYDPIVSTTSLTLTPFRNSDFLLEEVDAFLAIEDDPTSPKVNQSYLDPDGDILLLEAFLNDDPSLPPPNQGNYLPKVRKELKICEAKSDKSLIDEPPEVELKDLPPHLEYAFLEGDDKFPVIIAKYLSMEEKTALITRENTLVLVVCIENYNSS